MAHGVVYDSIVIGSGPAGGMVAYELSKQGFGTLIIEKETLSRYKTCGGGLVFPKKGHLSIRVASFKKAI